MGNMSAVETLQAIRAGFAALQAELEEAQAENERLKFIIASGEKVVNDAANQADARLPIKSTSTR